MRCDLGSHLKVDPVSATRLWRRAWRFAATERREPRCEISIKIESTKYIISSHFDSNPDLYHSIMPTPGGTAPTILPRKRFTASDPPFEELKAHFQSTWAWQLFEDPNLLPMNNDSRSVKKKTTADTFISKTLATNETIRA